MSASIYHLPAGTEPLDTAVVEQAIEWMVKLLSGTATNETFVGCERWRKQNPQHEQAWQQLQTINGQLKTLPKTLARATLQDSRTINKPSNRHNVFKSIALLFITCTLALTGYHYAPWQQLVADHGTAIGEQRTIALTDGTQMMLNTDSAVDIHFDKKQRLTKLLKGEILVTTGHETVTPYRPFSVQTAQGNIRALGTRFLVRQQADATTVAVYEGAVEVQPDEAVGTIRLNAGQQLRFTESNTEAVTAVDSDAAAWADGVIMATDMRLGDFVAELDRYRHGKIICDPSVADLSISGVFPLADTDRVIATLEQTLPITAEVRTRYWVTLRKSD